jgi:hypothetical protein
MVFGRELVGCCLVKYDCDGSKGDAIYPPRTVLFGRTHRHYVLLMMEVK